MRGRATIKGTLLAFDMQLEKTFGITSVKFLVYTQGGIKCGPSSHPDFIKNYFLLTRMLEFFDRRDKYRKSGLEAPLMGGIGERKRR